MEKEKNKSITSLKEKKANNTKKKITTEITTLMLLSNSFILFSIP
jgi:hypothetical protein